MANKRAIGEKLLILFNERYRRILWEEFQQSSVNSPDTYSMLGDRYISTELGLDDKLASGRCWPLPVPLPAYLPSLAAHTVFSFAASNFEDNSAVKKESGKYIGELDSEDEKIYIKPDPDQEAIGEIEHKANSPDSEHDRMDIASNGEMGYGDEGLEAESKMQYGDLEKAIRGESREEPTPFEFRCPHHRLGCESTVNCDESLRVHLKTCPTTAEEHASRRNKPFPCTEILDDGTICSRSFNGDPQLKRHIRHDHKGLSLWENRRCAEGKCNGTIIYKTQSEWTHHRRNSHSGFKPMHCPMRDCKGSKLFDKEKELLRHMEKLHFMTHEQRVAALPYKQEEKAKEAVIQDGWDQRKCPHPDCPSTTMFTNRTALLSHLKVKHDLKKSSSPKEFKLYLGAEWPPGNDSSSESGSD